MNRLLREPLVHFLLGGALLFILYGLVSGDESYAPDRIVVGADRVTELATTFQRTWSRPPTDHELRSLVNDFVDEEVLYREALALGLDRDDLVIRRRMRQKVEYLHSDLAEFAPPTEAELAEYLASNHDVYQVPAQVTFQQIYVNPGAKTGDASPYERAETILAGLRSGQAIDGDLTMLPAGMRSVSESEIGSTFGALFAADLVALQGVGWLGPVASSFGLHLVHIDKRLPARTPELDEIRREIARDFDSLRRKQKNKEFLNKLRARYEVEVRMPEGESLAEEPLAPSMEG